MYSKRITSFLILRGAREESQVLTDKVKELEEKIKNIQLGKEKPKEGEALENLQASLTAMKAELTKVNNLINSFFGVRSQVQRGNYLRNMEYFVAGFTEEDLQKEYELILEKRSTFSREKRDLIIALRS